MTIQYKIGDLLDAEEDIICHQVNCLGYMGAGLALQLRNKYPAMFEEYKKFIEIPSYGGLFPSPTKNQNVAMLMGRVHFYLAPDKKIIASLFAQKGIGNGVQTDYDSLYESLCRVSEYAITTKKTIAIPYKLGCGLAGGDWEVVEKIIQRATDPTYACVYQMR